MTNEELLRMIEEAERRLGRLDASLQADRDNVPEWLWMEQNAEDNQ